MYFLQIVSYFRIFKAYTADWDCVTCLNVIAVCDKFLLIPNSWMLATLNVYSLLSSAPHFCVDFGCDCSCEDLRRVGFIDKKRMLIFTCHIFFWFINEFHVKIAYVENVTTVYPSSWYCYKNSHVQYNLLTFEQT